MFWHLKNRIKEETGNDVDLFPPIVSSNQPKAFKNRLSQQGLTTNLENFTIDNSKENDTSQDITLTDGKVITSKDVKKLESKEDEWRKKLQKKEEDMALKLKKLEDTWKKQLEDKEKEMKEELDKSKVDRKLLENEINELKLINARLEENSKKALDYKKKICQYQEDIDQLQGFQTQEVAKIKHLLLVKEQEIEEKDQLLKDNNTQLKSLKLEITRLRNLEQQYENLQDSVETLRHSFDLERVQLTSKLAEKEEDVRHLKDRVALLEERTNTEPLGEMTVDARVQKLLGERALFERRLEEAHLHLLQIKSSWSGKIESLETQVGRLGRQASEESAEKRQIERERDLLKVKIAKLEEELQNSKSEVESQANKIEKLNMEKTVLEENIKHLKLQDEEKIKSLNKEISSLAENTLRLETELDAKKRESETNSELIKTLNEKLSKDNQANTSISCQLEILNGELKAERKKMDDLNLKLEKERREKDEIMMRNAEISQEIELVRQEYRKLKVESSELQSKTWELEKKFSDKENELHATLVEKTELIAKIKSLENFEKEQECASLMEKDLKSKVIHLENELFEKNKNLKVLQQRLADFKKTLQKELKVPASAIIAGGSDSDNYVCCLTAATTTTTSSAISAVPAVVSHFSPRQPVSFMRGEEIYDEPYEDINFTYLKHVLMKFLTSRECEAQHLIRAVATLLKFSAEEEKLLKETLEWKMSWFGTRPNLGNGQTAKAIPPR